MNRRDFLRAGGAGLVAALVAPVLRQPEARSCGADFSDYREFGPDERITVPVPDMETVQQTTFVVLAPGERLMGSHSQDGANAVCLIVNGAMTGYWQVPSGYRYIWLEG